MTISNITTEEIRNKFHDLYLTATEKRLDFHPSISNGKAVWEVLKKNGEETYIRFGLIPENGRSFNFRDQIYEDGVSCFKAYKLDDAYIVDVAGGYFTFLGYLKKQAYEITGDEMENTGSDGEPVLRNAGIVKEVTADQIFDIKSFINEVFND